MPILVTLLGLAAAGVLGYLATTGASTVLIVIGGAVLVSVFSFLYPKTSLGLLVFSMLLSPKLGFGSVTSNREAVLRYDDVLLVIMFFSWFARMAIIKGKAFITHTPLQAPILIYTSVYILSTALGIMRGNLDPKPASFYLLKYIEYFFLYFMTVNLVTVYAFY
jgi:hypothetical protein